LREILLLQVPTPVASEKPAGALTYEAVIGPMFQARCGTCHGVNGVQGLDLTTYESSLDGSLSGPVIIPGDPNGSLIVQIQSGDQPHFSQFTPDEFTLLVEWITAGAPER
jgi:mono/diheme cytochrome c family protein